MNGMNIFSISAIIAHQEYSKIRKMHHRYQILIIKNNNTLCQVSRKSGFFMPCICKLVGTITCMLVCNEQEVCVNVVYDWVTFSTLRSKTSFTPLWFFFQ